MLLIKNGYVKPITGADIPCGQVLIDQGKILAVGETVDAPADCPVYDATGCMVTPGLIDGHTHLGIHEEAQRWEVNDTNEYSNPVTPTIRGIDGINPMDEGFTNALHGGVTTAVIGPGSANVVGGTFAALKLHGHCVDDMVIKEPVAMKIAFGENPKGAYGQNGRKEPYTRMGVASLLRQLLAKTKKYAEDIAAAEKDSAKTRPCDPQLEALLPVIPLYYLPLCAGLAIREGLPEDAAWRAITINPAKVAGIDAWVGSLEPGKDADIAVFRGNPLRDIQAKAQQVFVGGEPVL